MTFQSRLYVAPLWKEHTEQFYFILLHLNMHSKERSYFVSIKINPAERANKSLILNSCYNLSTGRQENSSPLPHTYSSWHTLSCLFFLFFTYKAQQVWDMRMGWLISWDCSKGHCFTQLQLPEKKINNA